MGAKYIFRLDDICENMNWENYNRVKHIFVKYNIKPIIGVIPNNQDKGFLKYPESSFNFWSEVYDLQNIKGWNIALHGYSHVYESKNSGILKTNNFSEFAGLPKYKQCEKIQKGIQIFNKQGIRIDAFMAPAHSFDRITMECLKENGINVITDGYSLYPYCEDGILFVPQLLSKPRKMPFGIYTWCLHTNSMSNKAIDELEIFIKNNKDDIISFSEAKKNVVNGFISKIQRWILKYLIIAIRKLR